MSTGSRIFRKSIACSTVEPISRTGTPSKRFVLPRLKTIIASRLPAGSSLLDIGCAYGVFLEAASEAGFQPYGIDVSNDAVTHIRENLTIPAQAGQFPHDEPAELFDRNQFDAITLWYVIEHFPRLDIVLNRVSEMLRGRRYTGLSLHPTDAGYPVELNTRRFLLNSPVDHYSIWSPRVARKLLARYGMRGISVSVLQDIIRNALESSFPGSGIVFSVLGVLSRLFRLGDTFEVYAVKET